MAGIGATMLALFLAFDMMQPIPKESGGLVVERRAPVKAFIGESALVELTLSSEGRDFQNLRLEDGLPPSSQLSRGVPVMVSSFRGDREVTLRYEIKFGEPGQFAFGAGRVRFSSTFGLIENTFGFYSPFETRVYPRHLTPSLSPVRSRAMSWAGTTPSRYRGGRLDFMNIREYSPGDRVSDINWKASARVGSPLVNEWQVERGIDCVVIVDLFADDLPKVGDWAARGDVIQAAYEIASAYVGMGNRVGMLIMGKLLYKLKPGFGIRTLKAMVEGLIDSEEGDVWNIEYIDEYLEVFFRQQYFKRTGTLFFVTAGTRMRVVEAVAQLSGRGFVCNTVVIDPVQQEVAAIETSGLMAKTEIEFGARYAEAEFLWFIARLAGHSNVFEWGKDRGLVMLKRYRP